MINKWLRCCAVSARFARFARFAQLISAAKTVGKSSLTDKPKMRGHRCNLHVPRFLRTRHSQIRTKCRKDALREDRVTIHGSFHHPFPGLCCTSPLSLACSFLGWFIVLCLLRHTSRSQGEKGTIDRSNVQVTILSLSCDVLADLTRESCGLKIRERRRWP